ncbi:helix-turn-helix domain-containing protein [Kitasatospora sp. NPDC058965]|uniref:helix-turn-helix domain-containing protein n=1 Tax=Kitasatospora sp. NPDC058965 TaxID=3346682 RepID=UPI00369671AF
MVSPLQVIGAVLRFYREKRGRTQDQLGAEIAFGGSLISKVENGARKPTEEMADLCDAALGTGGAVGFLVRYLTREWAAAFPAGFTDFVEKEAEAREIRTYQLSYLPGPLQTRAYASALFRGANAQFAEPVDTFEERLTLRMKRGERLRSEAPPFFWGVIDEAALRRQIGTTEEMVAQLDHLIEMAQLPHVCLQVATLDLGERNPLAGSLTLLTMPDGSQVGYTEALHLGILEHNHELMAQWLRAYTLLQVEALSATASLELIRTIRGELSS